MDSLYKRVGTTKLVIEYNNIIKSRFQEAYKKYNIGNIHNKQYAAHLIINASSDIFSDKPLIWKIPEEQL